MKGQKWPPSELTDNDVKHSLVISLQENNNKNVYVYDLSHMHDLGSKVMTHSKQFQ